MLKILKFRKIVLLHLKCKDKIGSRILNLHRFYLAIVDAVDVTTVLVEVIVFGKVLVLVEVIVLYEVAVLDVVKVLQEKPF